MFGLGSALFRDSASGLGPTLFRVECFGLVNAFQAAATRLTGKDSSLSIPVPSGALHFLTLPDSFPEAALRKSKLARGPKLTKYWACHLSRAPKHGTRRFVANSTA